jgi:hypothetical protein
MVVYGARHCAGQLGVTGPSRLWCVEKETLIGGSTVLITALGSWEKIVPRGYDV